MTIQIISGVHRRGWINPAAEARGAEAIEQAAVSGHTIMIDPIPADDDMSWQANATRKLAADAAARGVKVMVFTMKPAHEQQLMTPLPEEFVSIEIPGTLADWLPESWVSS